VALQKLIVADYDKIFLAFMETRFIVGVNKTQKFLLVTRIKLGLRYGWSYTTWH